MNIPSDLAVNGVSSIGGALTANGLVTINGSFNIGAAAATGASSNYWSEYVDTNCNLIFQSSKGTVVEFSEQFSAEQLNFTGKHRCVGSSRIRDKHIGKIVCATGKYVDLENSRVIQIDEALPIVKLCKRMRDPTAFGVIGGIDESGRFRIGNMSFVKPGLTRRIIVQSQGEGAMWVTNAGGPLRNGDYIMTSWVSGYGMRQGSSVRCNYTIAKITCDCTFDRSGVKTIKFRGKTFKKAFVGCVYCF